MHYKLTFTFFQTLILLLMMNLAQANVIKIGTGPVNGIYFPIGEQLCLITIESEYSENASSCQVIETQGSLANLYQLNAGEVDFALVQSDWMHYAYTGTYVFATQGDAKSLRAVLSIYHEPFTVIAHQDANIQNFDDLIGKRVIIGKLGSGNRATLEILMRAKHKTMQDFLPVADEIAQDRVHALCAHQVDAVIDTIGHPNQWVQQAMAECPVHWVNLQDNVIDTLVRETPFYEYIEIPQTVYPQLDEPVITFGVNAVLVTQAETAESTVYDLLTAIFADFPTWQAHLPELALSTRAAMHDVGQVPLHPGAERFFNTMPIALE